MDISWKSKVARYIIEINITITEYHQNRDDLTGRLQLGSDELSGKGVSYTGKKSDYLVGGTSYQCGYWNQDVFRGKYQFSHS